MKKKKINNRSYSRARKKKKKTLITIAGTVKI